MPNKKLSQPKNNPTPEAVLKTWLTNNELTVSELSRSLGYKSNYIQLVIGPTQQKPVNFELVGRLLYTFGSEGPALDMAQAMKGE